jgi:hypothetical protein
MIEDMNSNLDKLISKAVSEYWSTRDKQSKRQVITGKPDQGSRSAVTGGAQMDGFIDLFSRLIKDTGISESLIFRKRGVEIPGFFRPTKEWDLLVVKDNVLIAVIEAKSQVGPSFGNNFNNRTEEAIGSAADFWTAFRERAYMASPPPFLGYFFMLEDCEASNKPVGVAEPHFKVFPEFKDASYMKRYELLCRKLVLERHYSACTFISSKKDTGKTGKYRVPAEDLSPKGFLRSLISHLSAHR